MTWGGTMGGIASPEGSWLAMTGEVDGRRDGIASQSTLAMTWGGGQWEGLLRKVRSQ